MIKEDGRVLENEWVKLTVASDGSLRLTDKELGKTLEDLLVFEDVGDIANEYIFKQPKTITRSYPRPLHITLKSSKIHRYVRRFA